MTENKRKEKQKVFNKLWNESKWKELKKYLFKWLEEEPDEHWLLAQIAEICYLENCYNEALEYAEKAWRIAPRCPLTVWEYGESLFALERYEDAEPFYRNLIHRGVNRIAHGECGEGFSKASVLVNDSNYRLGLLLANKNKFDLAKKYIKKYLANRTSVSALSSREAKKDLSQVLKGNKPDLKVS